MRRLNALRLIVADPETLLFAGLAMATAVSPIAAAVAYLFLHPQLADYPVPPAAARVLLSPVGAHAMALPVGLAIALPSVLIGTLLNVALIRCLSARLQGQDPSVGDALAAVWEKLGSWLTIAALTFSLLSVVATVAHWLGLDKKDEEGGLGRLAAGLTAQGVQTASAFVLAVMIIDRCGFREAVKRAYELKRLIPRMMLFDLAAAFLMPLPMLWIFFVLFLFSQRALPPMSGPAFAALMGVPVVLMGIAVLLLFVILSTAFICAVYLAASRPEARAGVAEYFPDAVEA